MLVKDVLNNPKMLSCILKGVVREYQDLTVDDIFKKHLYSVHRKLSYGIPYPFYDKECWYYDIDIPLEGSIEDMSYENFLIYTEDRRYLTQWDELFYFNGPDTLKRGYRIAIVVSEEDKECTVDDFTFKMKGADGKAKDIPGGYEYSHYIIIHLRNKLGKKAPAYLSLLYRLIKEDLPLEEKQTILMAYYWGYKM